jgi:hypothetical protein
VDETSATTPEVAPAQDPDEKQPVEEGSLDGAPGFRARGRARRRLRFLRKARELAYRDLGGLVFDLHRFGQRNDPLVLAKLGTLREIDTELRSLEAELEERQSLTILREAGVSTCPRCAAIHSGEDNFCPNCGLPMSRHPDLPIAAPAASPPTAPRAGALAAAGAAAAAGAPPLAGAARRAAPAPAAGARSPSAPAPADARSPSAPAPAEAPAGDVARSRIAGPAPATTPDEGSSNSPQTSPDKGEPAGPDAEGPTEILRPPRAGG